MARYILLRVADDTEADELLLDLAMHPEMGIRTGYIGASVHAELVNAIDAGDTDYSTTLGGVGQTVEKDDSLQEYIRASYRRAYSLCTQFDDNGDTDRRGH